MPLRVVEKAALSDVGRARQGNEDSYFEGDPVFAVADGMGGARAGEVASGIAVDTFDDEPAPDASPEERLAAVATDGEQADLRPRAGGRLARGHGHDVHRGAASPATRSRSATSATRACTAAATASSSG